MTNELQITEVSLINETLLEELSDLLIEVVESGASIGFLSPLSKEAAREYWKDLLGQGVILWVARLNQKVCGTIQLHLVLRANGLHRAEVVRLMVHPEQRRNGIARNLMSTLEQKAKQEGTTLLFLDTRAGDPSNILYKSQGYIEAGSIPRYAKSSNGELDATVFYYKEI
ncbi:GNAT family N-acetyltransferase [Metabacillus arenae]|uniref:GNAT family N-acetyltransferase n=1 Tax=Metabacillus arenae TaxID=2771434 RepID=A0A926RZ43_9BACI|nr:GNAT family N-acetyltransferase [Metabacillus arenae]MBD1382726.1 GNAT family N-acetyltransferase [Metabacillus arenae]